MSDAASAVPAVAATSRVLEDAQASASAMRQSLKTCRRSSWRSGDIQEDMPMDLPTAFPFVPELFLAMLVSAYSIDVLRAILSYERVRCLKIWREFKEEHELLPTHAHESEQKLCRDYLWRFAKIQLSMGCQAYKTEETRKSELLAAGMVFGEAPGDGNCLISSVLQSLLNIGLLPLTLNTASMRLSESNACRAALKALPIADPRRPVERDSGTNRIRTDVTDAVHANAYLQFDVHTSWIVDFFLARHKSVIPAEGIRCFVYSRFDDVLGATESFLLRGPGELVPAREPLTISVYNSTYEGFCGVHYDPLFLDTELPAMSGGHEAGSVPPPPSPHDSRRPPKRSRCASASSVADPVTGTGTNDLQESSKSSVASAAAEGSSRDIDGADAPGDAFAWQMSGRGMEASRAGDCGNTGMPSDIEAEDSFSEQSLSDANSDDDDIFEMRPETAGKVSAEYQKMWLYRWSLAKEEVGTHLREEVLLPLCPEDTEHKAVFTQVQRGVILPPWHCAFRGCTAVEKHLSTCDKHELNLWQHIWSGKSEKETHSGTLTKIVDKHGLKHSMLNLEEVAFTLCSMALLDKERTACPRLGLATDRRTLGHLGEVFCEEQVHVYMCFICGCKHICHAGVDKFGQACMKGNVALRQVGKRFQHILTDVHATGWKHNLSAQYYAERFGQATAMAPDLQAGSLEWKRRGGYLFGLAHMRRRIGRTSPPRLPTPLDASRFYCAFFSFKNHCFYLQDFGIVLRPISMFIRQAFS